MRELLATFGAARDVPEKRRTDAVEWRLFSEVQSAREIGRDLGS